LSSGKLDNLKNVENNANLSFHQIDLSSYPNLIQIIKDVEWIFHLAALADIVPSIQQPIVYHKSNVDGTISILEQAHIAGVKRFVYAASSSCYGIPDEYPTKENAEIRPMYPYALTKNIGEQYVMHWNKTYNLPSISLRLFNVYGPRARTSGTYGAVFGVFLAQKLAGKPFTVVGNGTQTRDFTYVTDVAEAFIRAAESEIDSGIFNVGSGNTYSVNQLVRLLGGKITYIPKRPGEPDSTFADISKITKLLNWQPQISFEDGVQIMLNNIELWEDAPVWEENSIANATKDWFKYLSA
jgi:UDP-glucose 4-epimerase